MLNEQSCKRGVKFRRLTDSFDTNMSMGFSFCFYMGVRVGGMLANGATREQISLVLEVSVKTVYRYIPAAKQRSLRDSVC